MEDTKLKLTQSKLRQLIKEALLDKHDYTTWGKQLDGIVGAIIELANTLRETDPEYRDRSVTHASEQLHDALNRFDEQARPEPEPEDEEGEYTKLRSVYGQKDPEYGHPLSPSQVVHRAAQTVRGKKK